MKNFLEHREQKGLYKSFKVPSNSQNNFLKRKELEKKEKDCHNSSSPLTSLSDV